jgi:hypothetical protein
MSVTTECQDGVVSIATGHGLEKILNGSDDGV